MDPIQLLREFGVPISLLAAILGGIWRALSWAAPRIDRVVDAHTEFVRQIQHDVREQKVILMDIRDSVRVNGEHIKGIPCVQKDDRDA